MKTQSLSISAIRVDGGTQSRAHLDEPTVARYAEAYQDGDRFPPVDVYFDGVQAWLADGFHRYAASARAGLPTVECNVRDGSRHDAFVFSLGANGGHGLPRSNADKRRAVELALADEITSKLSDRTIAKICKVRHPMVAAIRSPEAAARQAAASKAKREPAPAVTEAQVECHSTPGAAERQAERPAEVESDSTSQASVESDSTPSTVATPIPVPTSGPVTVITALPECGVTVVTSVGEPPTAPAPPPAPVVHDLTPEELVLKEYGETQAELERLQAIVEADEPLKAALEANKQLTAQVRQIRESLNGQINKNNELIRMVKSLQRKLKAAEK